MYILVPWYYHDIADNSNWALHRYRQDPFTNLEVRLQHRPQVPALCEYLEQ